MVVRRRRFHAKRDDEGVVMILALAFLSIIGFLVLVPLTAATTSAHATSVVAVQRGWQYDAEATAQGVAEAFRSHPTWGLPNDNSCHNVPTEAPNASSLSVNCLGLFPPQPSDGSQPVVIGIRNVAVTVRTTVSDTVQTAQPALTTLITFHDVPVAGNEVDLTSFSAVNS